MSEAHLTVRTWVNESPRPWQALVIYLVELPGSLTWYHLNEAGVQRYQWTGPDYESFDFNKWTELPKVSLA